MKMIVALLGCSLAIAPAFAVKPCDELKTEIAAKLDGKGLKNYQLTILAASDVKDETVVGSCEGGGKKIAYMRGDRSEEKGAMKKDDKGGHPDAPKGR